MTEEEAMTKWCPFTRFDWIDSAGIHLGINRVFDPADKAATRNCIASECMAWRTLAMGGGYCGAFPR